MQIEFNLNTILQIATLLGLIFAAYFTLRKPQEKSEINDAVLDVKFETLEKKLELIKNNDLHELKGMFNTHIANQSIYERETASRLGAIEAKIDILINKK